MSDFYYDETSPSCLRRKYDWKSGMNYQITKAFANDPAGWLKEDRCKYWIVKINGRDALVHRIIWEIHNGKIPNGYQIDHIDGNSTNNKISNLRCVVNKTNTRNQKFRITNTSSVCGVGLLINRTKYGENRYWKAQWNDLEGKRCAKCFSVGKHGEEAAFKLACEYRENIMQELNESGAGYSDDHGKRA